MSRTVAKKVSISCHNFRFGNMTKICYLNTLSILRINPPKFGGGLKFGSNAGLGQKGAFCKGFEALSPFIIFLEQIQWGIKVAS
jgi:hypothetical protein